MKKINVNNMTSLHSNGKGIKNVKFSRSEI